MYSVGLAYLLWFFSFFGALGFHRFYLGKIPTGVLWAFTGGLFGIGSIYDFFTLPSQVKEANTQNAILNGQRPPNNQLQNLIGNQTHLVSNGLIGGRETTEQVILRVARDNNGLITASELALASKLSIEDAKRNLDAMVSRGHAELRVRQSGTLVYAIPDLMDRNDPLVI